MSSWKIACGYVFVLGMILVSILMNFRFGFSHGSTPWDAWVYGSAAGLGDCIKALLPLVVVAAWKNAKYIGAVAAMAMFATLSAYSFVSGIGFAAVNRAVTVGTRTAEVDGFQLMQRQLADAEKRLAGTVEVRAPAIIKAELQSVLQTPVMRSKNRVRGTVAQLTNSCGKLSRWRAANSKCEQYRKLQQELAASEEANQLRYRIDELGKKLASAREGGQGTIDVADPQAWTIHGLTGIDTSTVKTVLALATGIIVELVSGLGLFVFGLPTGFGRSRPKKMDVPPSSSEPEAVKRDSKTDIGRGKLFPDLRMSGAMPSLKVH